MSNILTPTDVRDIEPECCWNTSCEHYTETVPMCCAKYLEEGECEDRYQLNDRDKALLQAQCDKLHREGYRKVPSEGDIYDWLVAHPDRIGKDTPLTAEVIHQWLLSQ